MNRMLFIPTSKKASIASVVVVITEQHVINCAPLTPTFLPKNPETIEPNKGNIIMLNTLFKFYCNTSS